MKNIYPLFLFLFSINIVAQSNVELKEMEETIEWLNTVFDIKKIKNDTANITINFYELRDTKLSGITLMGTKISKVNEVVKNQAFMIDISEISKFYFETNLENPKIKDLVFEANEDGKQFNYIEDDNLYETNRYILNFLKIEQSLIERMVKALFHLIEQNQLYYDKKQKF